MARGFVLALSLALIAGCMTKEPAHPAATESPRETPAPPPTSQPDSRLPQPILPGGIILSNCTGWRTAMLWPGPGAPPPTPSAWAPVGPAFPSIVMEGHDCGRVSVAGFERGPVQMVLEFTDNVDPPAGCRATDQSISFESLLSWGWSDPDLARLFNQRWGAPVYLLETAHASQSAPVGTLEQVEWGPKGQARSDLTIYSGPQQAHSGYGPYRFFWQNGTGVVGLDAVYESSGPSVDGLAYGTLAGPMHLAAPFPHFVAPGNWFGDEDLTGAFYQWSDLDCKQPSGSPPS